MHDEYKAIDENKQRTYADTSFVEPIIPFRNADPWLRKLVGFEFEPQKTESDSKRAEGFDFKYDFNKWLANKWSFRTQTLTISENYRVNALDWDLEDGVHLVTQLIDPTTREISEQPKHLYLLFLYKKSGDWVDANCILKVKEFIKHLELMPACPVETILLRATGMEENNWEHMEKLSYLKDKKATTERLDRVYRYAWGCTDTGWLDLQGKPYLKAKFNPRDSICLRSQH
jgi:hypothetical protein